MAPRSRGGATMPPIQPFDLPDPGTPELETPTADQPFTSPSGASSSNMDGDGEESLEMDALDDSSETSGSGSDEGDEELSSKTRMLHQSSSSLLMANAFAPPFYNRPPTPLPPSPSLTSLLRPTFSTTTSRPTTPDSSENDTPNDTESAVAKSARIATTVPRASPKVPTYEYYGFVLYLLSSVVFLMYLLWSYLPSPFLHQLGIHYYPNRWWSLAIPSFLVMTIVYIYVALASYNTGYLTLPMSTIENIVDEAACVAILDSKGRILRKQRPEKSIPAPQNLSNIDWKSAWSEGTDAVMDVPIGGVCEVLYG